MEEGTSLPHFLQAIEPGDLEEIEKSLAPSVVLVLRSLQPGSKSRVLEVNGRRGVMSFLREFLCEMKQCEIRVLTNVNSRAALEWGFPREAGSGSLVNRTMLVEFDGDAVSRLILMKDT